MRGLVSSSSFYPLVWRRPRQNISFADTEAEVASEMPMNSSANSSLRCVANPDQTARGEEYGSIKIITIRLVAQTLYKDEFGLRDQRTLDLLSPLPSYHFIYALEMWMYRVFESFEDSAA